MKEKRRRARPWLWIGAAAALIVLCVFVSAKDGGGHITDVPGEFYLQVSVLERGGAVTQYGLRDEARIRDVQQALYPFAEGRPPAPAGRRATGLSVSRLFRRDAAGGLYGRRLGR